jgi:hypothetical protein
MTDAPRVKNNIRDLHLRMERTPCRSFRKTVELKMEKRIIRSLAGL